MMTGAELIEAERRRQRVMEGYTIAHDTHGDYPAQLLKAGECYYDAHPESGPPADLWPWGREAWKPKGALRNLVRAGALALAADDAYIEKGQGSSLSSVLFAEHCAREIDLLLAEVAGIDQQ